MAEFESEKVPLRRVKIQRLAEEARLLAAYDKTITKSQLALVYQKFGIELEALIPFFQQSFFFKQGNTYDLLKVLQFNILYCDGDEAAKLGLLYDVLTESQVNEPAIRKINDERLLRRME